MEKFTDQVYYPGYALMMHRKVITPDTGDPPLTVNDPWRLRLVTDNGLDEIHDLVLSLDGTSLNLDYEFSPDQTRDFFDAGEITAIIEYGPEASVKNRFEFKLTPDPDKTPQRDQQ